MEARACSACARNRKAGYRIQCRVSSILGHWSGEKWGASVESVRGERQWRRRRCSVDRRKERKSGIIMSFNGVGSGWFSEINDMWKGIALSLKVNQVIHQAKTKYQVRKMGKIYDFMKYS